VRWRTWRGCLRGQRATCSTPRSWPRLLRTDTAPGRRPRVRSFVTTVSVPRAARPVRASPRGKPADHPRSTRSAARTWRGCLRGQRATRSTSHRSPRLFGTDTEPGRRLWLRSIVTSDSKYRVAQPAHASTRAEPANRPRSTRARWRTWRGCLCGQRATRSIPRRWPRLLRTDTVSGRRQRLRSLVSTVSNPVPHGPCALRPVENRPTSHGAHVRWRTWRGCLRGQRATRSTPSRWPRLLRTDTAPGRRLWHRRLVSTPSELRAARPVCASPRGKFALRPRSTRALADSAWLS